MRKWANQKNKPRNTREVRGTLPRARLVEFIGERGDETDEHNIFSHEFFDIYLIFTGAEAFNDDMYNKLYLKVKIVKKY